LTKFSSSLLPAPIGGPSSFFPPLNEKPAIANVVPRVAIASTCDPNCLPAIVYIATMMTELEIFEVIEVMCEAQWTVYRLIN